MKPRPVLALTMGDPAGIGPEICACALRDPVVLEQCVPVLFGDAGVLQRVLGAIRIEVSADKSGAPAFGTARSNDSRNAPCPEAGALVTKTPGDPGNMNSWKVLSVQEFSRCTQLDGPLIVDCAAMDAHAVEPGRISAACGRAAYQYIEHAIESALRGQVSGVVTAPIHKESLHLAGVPHPGHTEIFTALTGAKRSCMMLRSEVITVSMATTHIGYRDVPTKLSAERVLTVIELTAEAMGWLLGRAPRIGVCGLNPHAGEHGLFGEREEERFVEPAVVQARGRALDVTGPLVPDAAFTGAQRRRFDAIVTLYHDQGHIPFKMLAFDTGVNITLGLPIVRTSVDHGTAFDIAWKGVADPQSLFSAIRVAVELATGRKGAVV